jgi:hypothetical protein
MSDEDVEKWMNEGKFIWWHGIQQELTKFQETMSNGSELKLKWSAGVKNGKSSKPTSCVVYGASIKCPVSGTRWLGTAPKSVSVHTSGKKQVSK